MARKRMIDPGIWQSEQIARLTREQRLLFIGIFSNADDEGRLKGSPKFLKMAIFPGDEDITSQDIRQWRDAIAGAQDADGLAPIRVYSVNGMEYIELPAWKRWQKIDKPSPSVLPPFNDYSTSVPLALDERSTSVPPERKERKEEKRIEEVAGNADAPPPAVIPVRSVPKKKSSGLSLAPVVDAFRDLGLPNPIFKRGEARAAQDLLDSGFRPAEIAQCWQDHATGVYGDDFSKRDLSFDYLANRQRIANWKRWVEQGRTSRAGPNNGRTDRPGPDLPNVTGKPLPWEVAT